MEPRQVGENREYRVTWMIASGISITNTAAELSVRSNTISTCRIRILDKLELENSADLVRCAIKNGLVKQILLFPPQKAF
jgi:two-component system invasion response regulator UvrY